jgi:divalent metal cation (Fe/Co/Zn/Cd) transporter
VFGSRIPGANPNDPRWASADDWAALVAAFVIAYNGIRLLRPALDDLMDHAPAAKLLSAIRNTALAVPGVLGIEKLAARKVGLGYRVIIHVQASPHITLAAGHVLGGQVSRALHDELIAIHSVIVHMEPFHEIAAITPLPTRS